MNKSEREQNREGKIRQGTEQTDNQGKVDRQEQNRAETNQTAAEQTGNQLDR